jgi:catechol 2,3-dioxygenase-like lactoylglutathione lyase family enzyme
VHLSYVRVLVDDFPACFRFYRDTMGFEVLWGDENNVYGEFKVGAETRLAVTARRVMAEVPGVSGQSGGAGPERFMLVLEVDDVDAHAAALEGRGAQLAARPVDRPAWTVRTAHLRDPEGNLIEINTPLKG